MSNTEFQSYGVRKDQKPTQVGTYEGKNVR